MIKLAETRLVWCPKDFHERGMLPGSMYATTREEDMKRGSLAFWYGVGCSDYREADARGKAFKILVECIQAHVRDGISWDEIFKNVFARIEELSCIFSPDTYYKIDKKLIPSDDQLEKSQKAREKLFYGTRKSKK
jgi:hypothetical protein